MNKVSFGPASVLGYLAGAGWLIDAIVNSLEHNQAMLTGANKPPAIAALVALVATNFGRHYQAAQLARGAEAESEASFQPPESAATPDIPPEPAETVVATPVPPAA